MIKKIQSKRLKERGGEKRGKVGEGVRKRMEKRGVMKEGRNPRQSVNGQV